MQSHHFPITLASLAPQRPHRIHSRRARAGIHAARAATTTISTPAATKLTGSFGLIPYSDASTYFVSARAQGIPTTWSPDGNILYFISQRDGFRCIWAQHLDARKRPLGPAIAVFHAHESRRSLANVGPGDLRVSVARDKIVFNMSERTGNLWMTNLGGGR